MPTVSQQEEKTSSGVFKQTVKPTNKGWMVPKAETGSRDTKRGMAKSVEPPIETPAPKQASVPPSLPQEVTPEPQRPALQPQMTARTTGDALTDYAYAKSLGEEEGEDWFVEHYKPQALSCVNLNDHRLGTAALYFESDARGKFLMVEQGGGAVVLPAFGSDFVSGRSSLEGVFTYPAETSGGLTLARAARVERKVDQWTLVDSGEFRRG